MFSKGMQPFNEHQDLGLLKWDFGMSGVGGLKESNSMGFCFEKIMDLAMNIKKLVLANLVGEVMDKILEFRSILTFRTLIQKAKQNGFDCKKIMDSTMDIDKLNLTNLVGKVMDEILENVKIE